MTALKNKIDFALVFTARNANPNGDPLDGNRPRTTYEGFGEVSDVCMKRKVRNRWVDKGYPVFVQSDDHRAVGDNFRSLKDRADACTALKECLEAIKAQKKTKDAASVSREDYARIACETWLDVRAFGQVFAFKEDKKKKNDDKADDENAGSDAVSIGIRGPVSIQSAFSVKEVDVVSTQITKSVNLETGADPDWKASDTMGTKHRVSYGVYTTFGSINVQPASKTGFSAEDAEKLKKRCLRSSATTRPAPVRTAAWRWLSSFGGSTSTRTASILPLRCIARCTSCSPDDPNELPTVTVDALDGLKCTVYDGEY